MSYNLSGEKYDYLKKEFKKDMLACKIAMCMFGLAFICALILLIVLCIREEQEQHVILYEGGKPVREWIATHISSNVENTIEFKDNAGKWVKIRGTIVIEPK